MADNDQTKQQDVTADPEDGHQDNLDAALAGSTLLSSGTSEPAVSVTLDHEDEPHDDDEYEHEDAGSPLSAKILTALAFLVAGGIIALWAGPKIAPSLPSGLGTVKAWLMPGTAGVTPDDLAALREELSIQISEGPEGLTEADVAALIDELSVANAGPSEDLTKVRALVADLSDQAAALDRADLPTRLTAVETRLDGISGQLESLGTLAESADGLSEDAVAQIGKFAAMVDGLRSEIAGLSERDADLAQKLDEVTARTERRITETEEELAATRVKAAADQKRAEIDVALTEMRNAIETGNAPFDDPLERLAARLDTPVLAKLEPFAASGIAEMADLRDSFGDAARNAIRADLTANAEEGSAADRLGALIGSQVAGRSLTPQEGDSTDAILSRAEDLIRRDDPEALAGALTELRSLSPSAAAAMAGWKEAAQARLDALQSLDALAQMTQAVN